MKRLFWVGALLCAAAAPSWGQATSNVITYYGSHPLSAADNGKDLQFDCSQACVMTLGVPPSPNFRVNSITVTGTYIPTLSVTSGTINNQTGIYVGIGEGPLTTDGTNWLAPGWNKLVSRVINGVCHSIMYPYSGAAERINAAITDAKNRANGCTAGVADSSEELGGGIDEPIEVGDSSSTNVTWIHPAAGSFSPYGSYWSGSNLGKSNLLDQYDNTVITGPSSVEAGFAFINNMTASTSQPYALYQSHVGNTTAGSYVILEGVKFEDANYVTGGSSTVYTASHTLVNVTEVTDNSDFRHIYVLSNSTVDGTPLNGKTTGLWNEGDAVTTGNSCCTASHHFIEINSDQFAGVGLHIVGSDSSGLSNGVTWYETSIGHAAAGYPLLQCDDTSSLHNTNVNFFGLYEEAGSSDATTSRNINNGCGFISVVGEEIKGYDGSSESAPMWTVNGTNPTHLSISNHVTPFGATLPVALVVNNVTGNTTYTDSKGYFGHYDSAPEAIDAALTVNGSPVCTTATGCGSSGSGNEAAITGLRYGNNSSADTVASSAQMQSAIGTGVYDATGAASSAVAALGGTANNPVALASNSSSSAASYLCTMWGDSLTAGTGGTAVSIGSSIPDILKEYGHCTSAPNMGVPGQTSTQVAVREGAYNGVTTATIAGNTIPASGSVGITFQSGYEPVSGYSPNPIPMTIGGVYGTAMYASGSYTFTRNAPGAAVTVAANSTYTVDTKGLTGGFNIFFVGKNNITSSGGLAQCEADLAAMVAALPYPKRFVILTLPTSNQSTQWSSPAGASYSLYTSFQSWILSNYPNNSIDLWAQMEAAYDSTNSEDVLDHNRNVPPSSLRLYTQGTVATAVADTTSCPSNISGIAAGDTVLIDAERIYVPTVSGSNAATCTRGYASTTAATHAVGNPTTSFDTTHYNIAGQTLAAKLIDAYIAASDPGSGSFAVRADGAAGLMNAPGKIGQFAPPDAAFIRAYIGASPGNTKLPMNIGSVAVINPGAGYGATAPTLTFSNGASGTATLVNGSVTQVTMTTYGAPSTTGPISVTVTPASGVTPTTVAELLVTPLKPNLYSNGVNWYIGTAANSGNYFYGGSYNFCNYFPSYQGVNAPSICPTSGGGYITLSPGTAGAGGFNKVNGWFDTWYNTAGTYVGKMYTSTGTTPALLWNGLFYSNGYYSLGPTVAETATGTNVTVSVANGYAQYHTINVVASGTTNVSGSLATEVYSSPRPAAWSACAVSAGNQAAVPYASDLFVDSFSVTGDTIEIGPTALPAGTYKFAIVCGQ